MIDDVVSERSVSECVKIGYLQQKYKKYDVHTPWPSVRSLPPFKNPGYATVVPCTQNEKSAPPHLCLVSLLLGSFCEHCKNVW